jgi:hypothetical protein
MPFLFDHTPTAQEVFDEACNYFATSAGPSRTARVPSAGINDRCLYRGPDDRCCVAGHFLPDGPYLKKMDETDNSAIFTFINDANYDEFLPSWFSQHRHLLTSLQNVHDDHSNWDRSAPGIGWHRQNIFRDLINVAADHSVDAGKARELAA